MPNWKKVLVSGSNATLNTLQLSNTPTGTTETDILVLDGSGNIKSTLKPISSGYHRTKRSKR